MWCPARRDAPSPVGSSHVLAASLGEYTWFDSASQELITRQQCSSSVLKSHKRRKKHKGVGVDPETETTQLRHTETGGGGLRG